MGQNRDKRTKAKKEEFCPFVPIGTKVQRSYVPSLRSGNITLTRPIQMKGADKMILVIDTDKIKYQTLSLILADLELDKDVDYCGEFTEQIDEILENGEIIEDDVIQYINGKREECKRIVLLTNSNIDFDEVMMKGEEYAEGGLKGEEK